MRALVAYVLKTKGKEMSLLDENEVISLQIAVKKIPQASVKPKRIPLPYTLHVPGEAGICLITKDKKEKVKALLKECGVEGITKILPLDKLKKEFRSYEARIRLVDMYDLFLTDERVYHCVPQYLGKKFYVRKKRPHPVNLRATDLNKEISRARDATYLYLGRGPCSAVPVGHTGMPREHLIHNVRHALSVIVRKIPRGWKNIQSVHLKTTSSVALPLFNSLPAEPKLLGQISKTEDRETVEVEVDDT